ncbi:hypothetical protein [Streptomyces gilvus]|uniref:hypothetical protein n=1 Tax=Streptomyces gilvus TaxID=2920937 RepID=UPI001F0F7D93|nr:hypothetical protein [Streptomyces sp. CME 23]MCH5674626.1 hypothetical protein [Streptomyces sp. CME 23]
MGHGTSPHGPGHAVYDRRWRGDLLGSVRCSAALLGTLFLIDWGRGTLSAGRAVLWTALAVLLFVVLCPVRVSADEGRLTSRRLLRTRRLRTDLLTSMRIQDGITQRLVLRDAFGGRVELDPQVLVDNPDLWHRLHTDARRSLTQGTLLCGATALGAVSERVERETARMVFRVSGLESRPEVSSEGEIRH